MNGKLPLAYACYNKDEQIRLQSTSGGVFTLIATYIISELNGVVCGAVYDENFNVHHVLVDCVEDLCKLRGSKYPQSHIGNSYKLIKEKLLDGRYVLFTGTPCQVSGLKVYLQKEYTNLFCMDFVCHGVASRKIWRDYLNLQRGSRIVKNIVFKHKSFGWKKWYFRIDFENRSQYQIRGCMNEFMISFLSNNNVRPSCYKCHFKGLVRRSDITISDCWGVGERDPEMNDDKGLSALVVQSEKGHFLFDKIRNGIVLKEYTPYELMKENWTMFKSVPKPISRDDFFSCASRMGTNYALKTFFRPGIKKWLGYYWMRIKGKEK